MTKIPISLEAPLAVRSSVKTATDAVVNATVMRCRQGMASMFESIRDLRVLRQVKPLEF